MDASKAKSNLAAEVAVARPAPVESPESARRAAGAGETGGHGILAAPPAISLKQQKAELKEGRIVGLRCESCGYERVSPMTRCPECRSQKVTTRQFSTTGTVESYTIQSVASEQFLNETPFAFAIIKLDDGPRISGWIPWIAKPQDLGVGQKVEYVSSYKPGMMFEKR